MIKLNCFFPFSVRWLFRRVLLMLLPGLITILCHAAHQDQENVPPSIDGQKELVTEEDKSITIRIDDLVITDPDNDKKDLTLQLTDGDNYSLDEQKQTIIPDANFSGELAVPVVVSDGTSTSAQFIMTITVRPVNDPPVINGQHQVNTAEGSPVTLSLSHLIVDDPDNTTDQLTLRVLDGANYTVSGQTITPVPGFSGPLSVKVTVSDPEKTSEVYLMTVGVTANAPPQITGQATLTTAEETPITVSLTDLTVNDPDNGGYPSGFTLTVQAGENYTVEGTTVLPATNFFGVLTVPVVVSDGTDQSNPFSLAITVTNTNDAPVINGQVALSTPEGQPITLALSHLQVTDADDPDPATLSLVILSGANYSASGNTITPLPGFSGALTVGVMVNDGQVNSNEFPLQINVTPVNDPPQITGQNPLEMQEGGAIALSLHDLTVSDPDNTYPTGFTMTVLAGADYTFSGLTVTPSQDFTGVLTVNVVVNDGQANSAPFPLKITVTPQNDPPLITGPATLSTNEDVPLAITLADLQVTDPDNSYPAGFSLQVLPGEHYTLSANTIIPEADYSGTLQVDVQVSDGTLTSNIFSVAVQVLPVNDPPIITGQIAVGTAEDTPVTLQFAHLTVLDVDNSYPSGFSILISEGSNYSVSGTTITPALDFNGTLNVSLTVSDGTSSSAPFIFQIQVGDANDAPVITGQLSLATDEEKPVTLQLSHLLVTDPDNVYPNGFSLVVSAGPNYSVSGTTITPALNFAGVLSIPVRVNDGINNSGTFEFKLQVNQINDPPQFAAIPNQQITENTAAGSVVISEISKGPLEDDQQLTFVATSGNTAIIPDPLVQYGGGTTATLSYSVIPNTSGLVTITVVAIDNGGNIAPHQNTYSSSFQVEVTEINAAPTLDVINNIVLLEDAEQQVVNLTGITAGAGETQALSITVAATRPELFELLEVVYTSPASTGQLRFKTNPNSYGTVALTVTVTDNGSGVSPHVNSITRTFSVEIRPVNDPPVFTSDPPTLAAAGELYEYRIKASDVDGERVTFSAVQKPSWASLSEAGNGEAVLKGIPPASALGNSEIRIQAKDAAATVEQSYTLYVNVRPALASRSLSMEEDGVLTIPDGFFTGAYTDENGNALESVVITSLPSSGGLFVGEVAVKAGDTISAAFLPALTYKPIENFFGTDGFGWKAFDGFHFSASSARVEVSVLPVNDPPRVVFGSDTLRYEVNGEPDLLAPLAEIIDPDDDSLTQATIGFHRGSYSLEWDLLQFDNTGNISASYDFQSGTLHFTGAAPVDEYRRALRAVRYVYQNTIDPLLEPKTVFVSLHDGTTEGPRVDKVIILQYTFVEFEIPTGFTPNGDHANDTWIIDRPGGGLEEMDNAIISVYNEQGLLVFRVKGFETPWDGTYQGELLPAATYYYTIDLQLRNRKTYKGIVTILR